MMNVCVIVSKLQRGNKMVFLDRNEAHIGPDSEASTSRASVIAPSLSLLEDHAKMLATKWWTSDELRQHGTWYLGLLSGWKYSNSA